MPEARLKLRHDPIPTHIAAGGPHNAVFVVWEPMLLMSLDLFQASLRGAVGIWVGVFPPVNWRATINGPYGTVFVVWEPMLPMSLGLFRASLRGAVGIWVGAFPPVNWRATSVAPTGPIRIRFVVPNAGPGGTV